MARVARSRLFPKPAILNCSRHSLVLWMPGTLLWGNGILKGCFVADGEWLLRCRQRLPPRDNIKGENEMENYNEKEAVYTDYDRAVDTLIMATGFLAAFVTVFLLL